MLRATGKGQLMDLVEEIHNSKIIAISVLLSACVVAIRIHACLCLALLPWSQKHPRNHSFRVGLHKEVPDVIPVVEVRFFIWPPIGAA